MGWKRKRRKKRDSCDGCSGCDACDLFLFALPFLRTVPRAPRPLPRPTLAGRLGIAAIRCYQRTLSPLLRCRCRYVPSCSEYGAQAVRRYGLADGSRLAAARIRRCRPDVPSGTADPLR